MTSLNLLVLRASNPERLARFYSAFGLVFQTERHGAGPDHQTCDLGGSVLEIYPAKSPDQSTAGARLGFRVSSLKDAVAACLSDGAVLKAPHQSAWGYRAIVQDPEGHTVELIESD